MRETGCLGKDECVCRYEVVQNIQTRASQMSNTERGPKMNERHAYISVEEWKRRKER